MASRSVSTCMRVMKVHVSWCARHITPAAADSMLPWVAWEAVRLLRMFWWATFLPRWCWRNCVLLALSFRSSVHSTACRLQVRRLRASTARRCNDAFCAIGFHAGKGVVRADELQDDFGD